MKLVYERDTAHNYMIPQEEQYMAEDDYRIHMLMENQIRGLLPCGIRKKDGTGEFRYDITSRQSLEHLYSGRCMGEDEIRILMRGLFLTLAELKKYLLDASMLVLDPQMIYLDVETREPAFCYLPGHKKEITVSFQELSVYILRHLDAAQERTVLLGYRIYREASEENYCLDRLLRSAAVYTGETVVRNIGITSASESSEKEQNRMEKVCSTTEPDRARQENVNNMEWQQEAKTVDDKQEEKKNLSDSSKKEPSRRKQKEKQKQEQRKAKIRRKKEKKEADKKKFTGKTFLVICFVLALIMTLAAAWLWKLTTTQTGGIIFLLVGLMAYGCSLEPKKVSAEKEVIDYESYGLKEQPYIMEGTQNHQVQGSGRQFESEDRRTEKERLGDTSVLYERDLAEDPLMLTRMNSQKQEYIVLLQDQYTVGKLNTEADLVIHEPSVSRVHAKIQRKGGQYFVQDLNSTNGTFLNERRLMINERVQIHPGDTIAFARAQYQAVRC